MARTRVISGLIGVALLVFIAWAPQNILGITVFLISILGIYEFYNAISNAGYRPVRFVGYLSSVYLLLLTFSSYFKQTEGFGFLSGIRDNGDFAVYIILVLLLSLIVFKHEKYNITDISLTLFGIIYVVYFFSFILLTRFMENGVYYIWFIFIGAWATDTFAYIFGVTLGKHKLIPAVSPKKTIEGSVGGILGCMALTVTAGLIFTRNGYIVNTSLYRFAILGLLSGIVSQLGDLAASAVKRYVNIKDYGKIMPGHGGILDRFDSILFIAPVIYFYINSFLGA